MRKQLQSPFSSRQYMLSRDFEIFYYNDPHFSSVRNHKHTYYEFYFFLEGDVSMCIEDVPQKLHPGDVLLIPPGVSHYAIGHSDTVPYRRFVLWITQEYCNQLLEISSNYVYLMQQAQLHRRYIFHYDVISFHTLQGKIFRLIEEIHSERFGRNAQISLCVNDLILHLNRTVYEMNHPRGSNTEEDLYEGLIQYIEQHLEENLSLETLAQHFYVSKYHIAHLFKERLGLSIHQYIIKKRLAACRDAICGDASITQIYELYGFQDYSSFFRAFKKEYGMSPKEYRTHYLSQRLDSR